MDKIDMSLDDIIKQNRKLKKQLAPKNRPSGPAGAKRQAKKPGGQAKGSLQVKGHLGQLKQFRARIGGKKTLGKGVALQKKKSGARFQQQQQQPQQQQGVNIANMGPARKIGKQRLPVKKAGGGQILNRNRQQQQQQQRVQQSKVARQQQVNQRRGIQTIPQTVQGGRRKQGKINQQNQFTQQTNEQQVNRQQVNRQQNNRQPNRRQNAQNKRLQQNQATPRVNIVKTPRANNQRPQVQKQKPQNINSQLLTVSISNPRAMQNFKPVKINRNKPTMPIVGGSLSDRFGQFQQQLQQKPKNMPPMQERRQQKRGQNKNNSGRTVLLV